MTKTPSQEPDLQLLKGTLDVLALKALESGELHGYAIAAWIRERSGDELQVEDGALYTCLHRMERRKWLAASWGVSERGRRAKFYRLTGRGRRALGRGASRLERHARAMFRILGHKPAEEHSS